MIWLRRIGLCLLALVGVLALLLGGWVVVDAIAGPPSVETLANLTFRAERGTTGPLLRGYLAEPNGDGPFPAVLLIHEWWGLTPQIVAKADALAAEGYVVLAPDAYRGCNTAAIPRAIFMVSSTPRARIQDDLAVALDALRARPNVDATRVAVGGFCFGGTQSQHLAVRHADVLAAAMWYYGSGPIVDAAVFAPLAAQNIPVLVVYGDQDNSIPLDEVRAQQAALAQAGVDATVTVYPGVGHAFVQDIRDGGPSEQAWRQFVDFLDTALAPQPVA